MKRHNLRLVMPSTIQLDGTGWTLTLSFEAWRTRRRAADEHMRVAVTLSRPSLRALLEAIKGMHIEDRKRIAREAQRISDEAKVLEGG